MKTAMFLLLTFVLFNFPPAYGQQTKDHWLIGNWAGSIEGLTAKGGPNRTLRVSEVAPDGWAKAQYGITGQNTGQIDVAVDGAQVKFLIPTTNNRIELMREGENSLVGTFSLPTGKSFPMKLTKIKPTTEFDGDWSGNTAGNASCGGASYDLTVKDSLITGKLRLVDRRIHGATYESIITGQVYADGTAALSLKGEGRNTQFSGTFTSTEFRGTDARYGNRGFSQCTYEVELKRR